MPITSAKIEGKHVGCFAKKHLTLLTFAFSIYFRHCWVKRDLTVVVLTLMKSVITKDMSTNCSKGNVDKACLSFENFQAKFHSPLCTKRQPRRVFRCLKSRVSATAGSRKKPVKIFYHDIIRIVICIFVVLGFDIM